MPEHKQLRVLLAVSNERASSTLRAYLRARGNIVEITPGSDLASTVGAAKPDIVLLEVELLEGSLALLRANFPETPVVVISAQDADLAFHAARMGAAELLTLPLDETLTARRLDQLLNRLDSIGSLQVQNGKAANLPEMPSLFSSSPRMSEIRDTIDKVATTSATVLIRGESGVGKEVVARAIFARSGRNQKSFVKVNCAAIPNDLLESELFGYEAGAFTGAQRSKPGKFELANGGTLFLDEIAEMHPALQAKLLHVLQDGEFARLGAKRDTAVDVRVLCATNKLLEQRVAEGLFREDLFYRINVVTVHIPPLRERRDEIPGLIRYFLEKYASVYGRKIVPLSDEIMKALVNYAWPGNIRELENLCKRYVIVGRATQIVRELTMHALERPAKIEKDDSSPIEFPVSAEPSLLEIGRRAAWQAEKAAIQEMLEETRWNRRVAARRLRVSYKALLNRIKQIEEDGKTKFSGA